MYRSSPELVNSRQKRMLAGVKIFGILWRASNNTDNIPKIE